MTRGSSVALLALALSALAAAGQPPACPGSVKTDDSSVSCEAYCKGTGFAAGQEMTSTCRCRTIIHPEPATCAAGAVDTATIGNSKICYYDSCSLAACPGSVKTHDYSVSCEAYCKGTGFAAGQMMDGSTCRCRTIIHPEPSTCAAGAVDTATIGNSKICYYDSCSLAAAGPPACPGSVKTDDSSVSCDAYCTGTGSAAGQMTNDNACRCRTIHPEPSTCAAGAVDTWKYQNSLYCYYDSCSVEVPKDAGAISTAEKAQMPAAQQGHGATARAFLLGAALAAPMGAALTYLALRSGRKLPASEPLLQQ